LLKSLAQLRSPIRHIGEPVSFQTPAQRLASRSHEASVKLSPTFRSGWPSRSEGYLRRAFADLPEATTLAQIEALLPWNVARSATQSVAA
jgi:hypothetical protein